MPGRQSRRWCSAALSLQNPQLPCEVLHVSLSLSWSERVAGLAFRSARSGARNRRVPNSSHSVELPIQSCKGRPFGYRSRDGSCSCASFSTCSTYCGICAHSRPRASTIVFKQVLTLQQVDFRIQLFLVTAAATVRW